MLSTNTNLLDRFDAIFSVDFEDVNSLFLATGGRSSEIIGFIDSREKDPILWLTGGGFGSTYAAVNTAFDEDAESFQRHYLHLSVLTYVMVFGVPFVFIFFALYIYTVWRARYIINNFYVLGSIAMFVWSLFGAGMIVEPMFWFFWGATISISRRYNKASSKDII
jgi:hypothetical protein